MGRPRKNAKTEETEKQEVITETATKENEETAASADKDTVDVKPTIRILSHGSSPKLSKRGQGDLEYEVGIDDESGDAYIRIAGNASSGAYSTKWIKLNDVRAMLDAVEEDTFKAVVLRDLYLGKSSCNYGYLGAILKTLGVLVGVDKPPSALKVGRWDALMEKITQLKEEGVSLKDEIAIAEAEKAKKKQAAAGKRKAGKKKTTSKA